MAEAVGEKKHDGGLVVGPGLVIPESELEVRHSRSGGPGGQNVNKVSTRVEVRFDIVASDVLSPEEKRRLRSKLATRTSQVGVLRVVSQRERTQGRNEAMARCRLAELVAAALAQPKKRRATRPGRAARERRLQEKQRRAEAKRRRREQQAD